MEEFRIGSIEVVRAFNTLSHPYPDGGGGGCQGQVHLHPLSNIKSEDRDSTLSTGKSWDRYLCVRLRVMPLLRESKLKGVKKGRDHFEGSFY